MHFESYIKLVKEKNSEEIAKSISDTVNVMLTKHIKGFDFKSEKSGLLLGNVQSGKTGHMLGVLSAAADNDFDFFIIMTSDNTSLQIQTLERALGFLDTFCVCGENDDYRFKANDMRKPVVIVIKKNSRVLETWNNHLNSSNFLNGRSIFIIDDEGDAASLNTKTNMDDEFSTINKKISAIRKMANSSFYLQVTATPQSIFLQEIATGYRPEFVHCFEPGKGYLGGEFFYNTGEPDMKPREPYSVEFTCEGELHDLLDEQSCIPDGMLKALASFLVTSSHTLSKEHAPSCNFLVHPSVSINAHEKIADKIGNTLNLFLQSNRDDKNFEKALKDAWENLHASKPDIINFKKSFDFVSNLLETQNINIFVMNSKNKVQSNFNTGVNIIIGGNSLGRGLTFPNLQTTYYCRKSKRVQADTVWQHCRAFGYDRDPGLARIFLPPSLFKIFSGINNGNNAIIEYVSKHGADDLKLIYPRGINPTRSNVVNKLKLGIIAGGVNYFPFHPKASNLNKIDAIIEKIEEGQKLISTNDGNYLSVGIDEIKELIKLFKSGLPYDWPAKTYLNCIESLQEKHLQDAVLIVRRDRNIGTDEIKGTRTLLSPNDRKLGDMFDNKLTLTLYKVNGDVKKGWAEGDLWIPNIKLPKSNKFYGLEE